MWFIANSIGALIAAQAHSKKEDRAVVISARNFLRSMGGSAGLAVADTIFSNIVQNKIPATVPQAVREAINASIFSVPDLSRLSEANRVGILDAYMAAQRGVFILWACCIGMCLLLMVCVKDKGLKRSEATPTEEAQIPDQFEPKAFSVETKGLAKEEPAIPITDVQTTNRSNVEWEQAPASTHSLMPA